MEIVAKIKEDEIVDLIVTHLAARGLYVSPDEAESVYKTLANSKIFPLHVATEFTALPAPAPVVAQAPAVVTTTPSSAVEVGQTPPPPAALKLRHTALVDPNGTGPTRDLEQDEGMSIGDQMARLLRDNAEMIASKG